MLISFETMKMLINMLITLNYCRHQKEIVNRNNCSNCVNKRNAFMHLFIFNNFRLNGKCKLFALWNLSFSQLFIMALNLASWKQLTAGRKVLVLQRVGQCRCNRSKRSINFFRCGILRGFSFLPPKPSNGGNSTKTSSGFIWFNNTPLTTPRPPALATCLTFTLL